MIKPIQREHTIQAFAAKFIEAALDEPHELLAFDRAKPPGRSRGAQLAALARQKARGIKPATPDMLLITKEHCIWWEWKAPKEKVTEGDDQDKMGARLQALGHWWSWGSSIVTFHGWLEVIGVRMRSNAAVLAQYYEAKAMASIGSAEMKAGKLPKRYKVRPEKPAASRIKKMHAVRGRVMV